MTGTIAILGATGTIGRHLSRRLASEGRKLLFVGRNQDRLSELAHELGQPGAVVDFSNSQALEDALKIVQSDGHLDGIVNCIGSVLLKPAHATTDDEFRRTIETNLFTSFATVRAAGRLMREHGGSVILFASAAAEIGIQNHEAIAAAKAGVIGLARSAASTYAGANLRFNVICPGLVKTDLTKHIWQSQTASAASCSLHALGRLGEPEQIASLASWLLHPENNWITGQSISIDGGLSKVLPRR